MNVFVVLVMDVSRGPDSHREEIAEFCSESDFLDKLLTSGLAYYFEYVADKPHNAELLVY